MYDAFDCMLLFDMTCPQFWQFKSDWYVLKCITNILDWQIPDIKVTIEFGFTLKHDNNIQTKFITDFPLDWTRDLKQG